MHEFESGRDQTLHSGLKYHEGYLYNFGNWKFVMIPVILSSILQKEMWNYLGHITDQSIRNAHLHVFDIVACQMTLRQKLSQVGLFLAADPVLLFLCRSPLYQDSCCVNAVVSLKRGGCMFFKCC